MTRVIITAASFALITTMAGATPLYVDDTDPLYTSLEPEGEYDFSAVTIGSTKLMSPLYFAIGDVTRDEGLSWIKGPYFNLVFGSSNVFSFENPICNFVGIGGDCSVDVVFAPNAVGNFHSVFEISAFFSFTEYHYPDFEVEFEYDDSFRVSFFGTGISPVPLPPAAAGSLIGLGLLGWLGRKRRARRLTIEQTE